MRKRRVWARLLGLGAAVVEDVYCGEEGEVVVSARPRWQQRDLCGVCGRRCPGEDLGEGRRRWRALDLGEVRAFVEAESPRVRCPEHALRHDPGGDELAQRFERLGFVRPHFM